MKILVFQFLFVSFVMHGQSTSTLHVRFFNPVSIETLPILQKMAMRLQLWCNVHNWKKRLFFLKDYGSYLYWNPRMHKRTNILIKIFNTDVNGKALSKWHFLYYIPNLLSTAVCQQTFQLAVTKTFTKSALWMRISLSLLLLLYHITIWIIIVIQRADFCEVPANRH